MDKEYMISFENADNEKLYQDIKARLLDELNLNGEMLNSKKSFEVEAEIHKMKRRIDS